MKFETDQDIAANASEYALAAVDFAKDHCNAVLDFSDDSIEKVEEILGRLHKSSLIEKPSAEQIWEMAKIFGSYIGEVFRRNHGAKWGLIQDGTEEITGMEMGTCLIWPWIRVNNRLTNGDKNNVWDYFKMTLKQ